jgi:CheY-like chemotaxis protein
LALDNTADVDDRCPAEPLEQCGTPLTQLASGLYPRAHALRVLIVDDEPALRRALVRDLSPYFLLVDGCESAEQALDVLKEGPFDVVVTDLALGGLDGISLVKQLTKNRRDVRCVLISGGASARDSESARRVGAVRVLCKPFTTGELRQAICDAAESRSGFQGELHGVSLVDILQLYHHARRSVCLRVGRGVIAIRDGEIRHAELGALSGEAALREMLALRSGEVQSNALTIGTETISRTFQELLLDSIRFIDEQNSPSSGIVRAESAGLAAGATLPPTESTHSARFRIEQDARVAGVCLATSLAVDGCVGCFVVDVVRRVVLGLASPRGAERLLDDPIAGSVVGTFCEQASRERGLNGSGSVVREVHVASSHRQYFAKTIGAGPGVILLLTGPDVRLGLLLVRTAAAVDELTSLVGAVPRNVRSA